MLEPYNPEARPIEEWHEDMGMKLWWSFPVNEPPYVGSPLDTEWSDGDYEQYFTHFTDIPYPSNMDEKTGNLLLTE